MRIMSLKTERKEECVEYDSQCVPGPEQQGAAYEQDEAQRNHESHIQFMHGTMLRTGTPVVQDAPIYNGIACT